MFFHVKYPVGESLEDGMYIMDGSCLEFLESIMSDPYLLSFDRRIISFECTSESCRRMIIEGNGGHRLGVSWLVIPVLSHLHFYLIHSNSEPLPTISLDRHRDFLEEEEIEHMITPYDVDLLCFEINRDEYEKKDDIFYHNLFLLLRVKYWIV